MPRLSSKDLRLEIDTAMKNLSPDTTVMLSFQFRRNEGNYYTVYFRSTGNYTVNISYNSSLDKLLDETAIPGFILNSRATNRYGFSAINTSFTPLFNGQELLSVDDGNINRAGLVYIAIYVSRGGSAIVELDNLIVIDKSTGN